MSMMLLSMVRAALAGDVVLPEFSAAQMADFPTAEAVTATLHRAMLGAGLSVDGPDLLVATHPDLAVGCADTPGCPVALLARMGGQIAVVGDVASNDDGRWEVVVRFFSPGQLEPVQTIRRTTSQTTLELFAQEVVPVVRALLPAPAPVLPPAPEPEPEPEPEEVRLVMLEGPTEAERQDPRLLALPAQTQERFVASGEDLETWLEGALIRTGHVYVEFLGGAAFGDISRRYDTRVSVTQTEDDDFAQSTPYEYEAFIQGAGATFGLSIGYAPLWWLETGVVLGAALGQKELSAGWEQRDGVGTVLDENTVVYEPVNGLMGALEPRLRMFFVPTGAVKPYATGGLHVRIYDGFTVPDVQDKIDYSDRPGGVGLGASVGGGLSIESPGGFSGFVEVPWTYLLSPQPYLQQGEDLVTVPTQAPGSQQILMLRAGLGFRL